MGRLSIELPKEQHKKIKALAAWHGLSLKDYIIERSLPSTDGDQEDLDLKNLMGFLAPRIKSASQGKFSKRSMKAIMTKAKSQRGL